MTLEVFLERHEIKLEKQYTDLMKNALLLMQGSVDPLHDDKHVYRMLDDLNCLIPTVPIHLRARIDYAVLLTCLCWHDVWKARRNPKNLPYFLFRQWWDGIGSALEFRRFCKCKALDKRFIKSVIYGIRKHATFQILPTFTLEAKILRDLDNLEVWNLDRIEPLKKMYLFPKPNKDMIKLGMFYIRHFMSKEKPNVYHFDWSRREGEKRKALFITHIELLEKEYQFYKL